jgi:hypothetical protein
VRLAANFSSETQSAAESGKGTGKTDLMMQTVSISETSVNFYQTTRRNIPADSSLHTHRRDTLISPSPFVLQNSFTIFHFLIAIY